MVKRVLQILALLVVVAPAAADPPALTPQRSGFMVLVHPSNPVSVVRRSYLVEIFLKKVTRWPTGELIRPADLSRSSPVRRRFCEEVLGRSLAAVRSYWQQQIFSGRDTPPPEFDSDAAAVSFVLSHPGAIAYIDSDVDLRGAKVVTVK